MPIAWKGTLAQYAGRLHRLNDAKREVIIYDYVDMRVPVLARMAAKRRIGYRAIGYKTLGARDLFSGWRSHRTCLRKLLEDQAVNNLIEISKHRSSVSLFPSQTLQQWSQLVLAAVPLDQFVEGGPPVVLAPHNLVR